MSYITQRGRYSGVYNINSFGDHEPRRKRSEGRLKRFESCTDTRAWSTDACVRCRHLLDIVSMSPGQSSANVGTVSDTAVGPEGDQDSINVLADKCRETEKYLQEALEKLEKIHVVIDENNELRNALVCSEMELQTLKKQQIEFHKTVSKLPIEICDLERKLMDSLPPEQQITIYKQEVSLLKKYCGSLSSFKDENETLRAQLDACHLRDASLPPVKCPGPEVERSCDVKHLQSLIKDLRKTVIALEPVEKERNCLRTELARLSAQMRNMDESYVGEVDTLRKRSEILDNVIDERDNLRERLDRYEGMDDTVKMLIKKARVGDCCVKERDELIKRVKELECKLCKSKCEVTSLTDKNKALTISCQKLCKERDKLLAKLQEVDKTGKEIDNLKCLAEEFEVVVMERDELVDKLKCFNCLRNELCIYKAKYEDMCEMEQCLKSELDQYVGKGKGDGNLQKKLEECQAANAELEEEVKGLLLKLQSILSEQDELVSSIKEKDELLRQSEIDCACMDELKTEMTHVQLQFEKTTNQVINEKICLEGRLHESESSLNEVKNKVIDIGRLLSQLSITTRKSIEAADTTEKRVQKLIEYKKENKRLLDTLATCRRQKGLNTAEVSLCDCVIEQLKCYCPDVECICEGETTSIGICAVDHNKLMLIEMNNAILAVIDELRKLCKNVNGKDVGAGGQYPGSESGSDYEGLSAGDIGQRRSEKSAQAMAYGTDEGLDALTEQGKDALSVGVSNQINLADIGTEQHTSQANASAGDPLSSQNIGTGQHISQASASAGDPISVANIGTEQHISQANASAGDPLSLVNNKTGEHITQTNASVGANVQQADAKSGISPQPGGVNATLSKCQSEADELRRQLANLQKDINDISNENTKLKNQTELLSREVNELHDVIDTNKDYGSSAENDLQNELKRLKEQLANTQMALDTKTKEQQECMKLYNENKDQDNVKASGLQTELKSLESENSSLKDELARLKEAMKNASKDVDLSAQMSKEKSEKQAMQNKVSDLEDEIRRLNEKLKGVSDVPASGVTDQMKNLTGQLEKEGKRISDLEAELAKCKNEAAKIKSDADAKLKDELAKLKSTLEMEENSTVDRMQDIASLTKKGNDLMNENTRLENENKKNLRNLADCEAKLAALLGKSGAPKDTGKDGLKKGIDKAAEGTKADLADDCAKKLKELQDKHNAEMAAKDKKYEEGMKALKTQFERDVTNVVKDHKDGVDRLQSVHQDMMTETMKAHESEMGSLELERQTLLTEVQKTRNCICNLEKQNGELQCVIKKMKSGALKKCVCPNVLSEAEVTELGASGGMENIMNTILSNGIQSLSYGQLKVLHTRTCAAAAVLRGIKGGQGGRSKSRSSRSAGDTTSTKPSRSNRSKTRSGSCSRSCRGRVSPVPTRQLPPLRSLLTKEIITKEKLIALESQMKDDKAVLEEIRDTMNQQMKKNFEFTENLRKRMCRCTTNEPPDPNETTIDKNTPRCRCALTSINRIKQKPHTATLRRIPVECPPCGPTPKCATAPCGSDDPRNSMMSKMCKRAPDGDKRTIRFIRNIKR